MPNLPPPPTGALIDHSNANPVWLNWFNAVYKMIGGSISTSRIVYANDFGAKGDGVTDDTSTIQAAIDSIETTGGVVNFAPGTYIASRITIPSYVLLDGGSVGAVELKLKASSNQDFVISKNFASLTGTGKWYYNDPSVPRFFGLRNIRINGNKAEQSGQSRGIAFYGNCQQLWGIVDVYDCTYDNIHTEASSSGGWSTTPAWPCQEEGFFECVVSRTAGRYGWYFIGCHNSNIRSYNCILDPNGSYGWYSENSNGYYNGSTDRVTQMHVYTASTNTTNRLGYYIASGLKIGYLDCDSCSATIATPSVGSLPTIDTLIMSQIGTGGTYNGLTNTCNRLVIGKIIATTKSTASGITLIDWQANSGAIGHMDLYDNSTGNAGNVGIYVTGASNNFPSFNIESFSGTSCYGMRNAGSFNRYGGTLTANKINFDYVSGSNLTGSLMIVTSSGQTAMAGQRPGNSDRLNVVENGVRSAGTYRNAITSASAGNQIDLTITTVQSVNIPHTCLYTPISKEVQISWRTTATTIKWDYPPTLQAIDATNVTVHCKLGTASIVPGTVADIMVRISQGS